MGKPHGLHGLNDQLSCPFSKLYFSDHFVLVGLASVRAVHCRDTMTGPDRRRRRVLAIGRMRVLFMYM